MAESAVNLPTLRGRRVQKAASQNLNVEDERWSRKSVLSLVVPFTAVG